MAQLSEYERLLGAVTSNPEDDDARLAFAAYIRGSDPDRASFIEQQIEETRRRRLERSFPDTLKHALLAKHESRWTHTIAKYARQWTYDRGFIAEIQLDPYIFLEYGEWLLINEPIRIVNFAPMEPGPFPTRELAESPLLARLDSIGLGDPGLSNDDLRQLAESPHLTRIVSMGGNVKVAVETYEMLAAIPRMRRALSVRFEGETFPGQDLQATDRDDYWGSPIWAWRGLTSKGKELEQKFGYIPWLHPKDNSCYHLDAAWFVSQKILPVKQPGSPVDEK